MSSDAAQTAGWEHGWEGHERGQLLRLSRLPLTEKLDWLEEAAELAELIARQHERTGARPGGDRAE